MSEIKVGSQVKAVGDKYATGQTIPNWVKQNPYTVKEVSGQKALLGSIMSWVYTKDLQVVGASTSSSSSSTSAPAASSTKTTTAYVACDVLNVRNGAGTNHSILGTVKRGQSLTVHSEKNGWLEIAFNGKTGWCSKQYTSQSGGGGSSSGGSTTAPAASSGGWTWPSAAKRVTSTFGYRKPILLTNGKYSSSQHDGVDICGGSGTAIYAAKGGTATNKTNNLTTGYGRMLEINHGDGTSTRYAHLSAIHKTGSVNAGDTIASEGATGGVTGAHLHFEVRVGGTAKDPLNYIKS